ncbi:MAG: hypothetical protein NZ928_02345 [Endomicrobia bacterium]|nr:hypothetical protein [Endomicrobiia bacterium]MDW8056100.1 hypothetical protein [Elusimicrobiota bacterium]
MLNFLLIYLFSLISFCNVLCPLGISTEFNNIFIENLQIGSQYNLTVLTNLPFKAKNTSEKKVKLKVQPVIPSEVSLKEGFEVIPSTDWVEIINPEAWVNPGEYISSDVVIKIPNNTSLLGRKFQVNIWCYVVEVESFKSLLAVTPGVEGRLLFSITHRVLTTKIKPVDINFELNPKEIYAMISSTSSYVCEFEIKNNSRRSFIYYLRQVEPEDVNIVVKTKYDRLPINKLELVPSEIKIKGGSSKNVVVMLKDFEGIDLQNKYFAVIEVQVLGKGISAAKYVKIFLNRMQDYE